MKFSVLDLETRLSLTLWAATLLRHTERLSEKTPKRGKIHYFDKLGFTKTIHLKQRSVYKISIESCSEDEQFSYRNMFRKEVGPQELLCRIYF